GGGLAALRVQGEARRCAPPVPAVRALPPATGLADVVLRSAPRIRSVVRGAAGAARRRGSRGPPATGQRPLRRSAAPAPAGAVLRLPLRHGRGASRQRCLVGAARAGDPGSDVNEMVGFRAAGLLLPFTIPSPEEHDVRS